MILIATPYRSATLPAFLERHRQLVASFDFRDIDDRMVMIDGAFDGRKYSPNADARNRFIAQNLESKHDWVLWTDADLVEARHDLIVDLLVMIGQQIVNRDDWQHTIAAPFVLIEGQDRFYDYGGFIQNGHMFSPAPPYCDGDGVIELDSVGSCYLVPAELYRMGGRYDPVGDEVEHLSFHRFAKSKGYRIFANRGLTVRHADLPRWGLAWH